MSIVNQTKNLKKRLNDEFKSIIARSRAYSRALKGMAAESRRNASPIKLNTNQLSMFGNKGGRTRRRR